MSVVTGLSALLLGWDYRRTVHLNAGLVTFCSSEGHSGSIHLRIIL